MILMNAQPITGGIFYCRDSAKMKSSTSLENLYRIESEVLRNRQQKHTAKPLKDETNVEPQNAPDKTLLVVFKFTFSQRVMRALFCKF